MPGLLSNVHQKFEKNCHLCHNTSNKKQQGKVCVKCHDHKNILNDLNKKTGFHGQLSNSQKFNCKHCHTDHEGRLAKIILLDASTFDHNKTDFILKGTHKNTICKSCHKSEKKYSQAPDDCFSCHKKSDVHEGKQGKKCANCHVASNWKKTRFNHDKTKFPLHGAHKKTHCNACHLNQRYKQTPKNCFSCHQINDVHRGTFGKKCQSCHNTKKWQQTRFDHSKKTDFALFGQHKKTACDNCHTPGKPKKKLPEKCFSCHKNDDSHKGRYGEKCNTCHQSSSWQKQTFDHNKKTDFPLSGKHKLVACTQCHKGNLYIDKLKSNCFSCHKSDDIHNGKQGRKCGSCHNEKGWRSNVLFDHDLASFPLIGMHAATQCEECHLSDDYSATPSSCNQCHSSDDVHKTKLGTDCESCHNPNSWNTWLFDHDKATHFKLDGAHKKAGCYDCHKTHSKGKLKISSDCISCHRSEDVHNRQFGRNCGKCHNTTNFSDIKTIR